MSVFGHRCPACHQQIPLDALLCNACGTAFGGSTRQGSRARPVMWLILAVLGWLASTWGVASYVYHRSSRSHAPVDPIGEARRGAAACLTLYVYGNTTEEIPVAQGSGFIIDPSGLGATNFHVLAGASRAEVRLSDKRLYDVVRIIAYDRDRDVVLFQLARYKEDGSVIIPSGMKTVSLGDPDRLRPGDRVVAIGSPEGFENTLSDGLVSGLRESEGLRWIQFSAPISPGSSGGPLFDATGHVVGLVTLQWREAQNLNFAVPVVALDSLLAHPDPLSMQEFGNATADERDTGEEEDAFRRAFHRGNALFRQGRVREALEYYRASIALQPAASAALYNAALCLESLGQDDQAAALYRRFLRYAPRDDRARARVVQWLSEHS